LLVGGLGTGCRKKIGLTWRTETTKKNTHERNMILFAKRSGGGHVGQRTEHALSVRVVGAQKFEITQWSVGEAAHLGGGRKT